MSEEEKVPSLEIEETEVKPVELPKGAKLGRSEGQQDFGKDPNAPAEEPDDGSHPLSGKDSGKFPRATTKRDRKAEAKKLKEQKNAFNKYVQQMRKPVRHGEMQQILQHIEQNMLAPKLKVLEDLVDKLQLLPDFIGNCLGDDGKFDIEPSLESFEDFFEKYMKKLEEEQKAEEERLAAEAKAKAEEEAAAKEQDDECSCESGCEKCTPDPEDTPETEETQKE